MVNKVELQHIYCTVCLRYGRISYFTSIDEANTSSFSSLSSYEQNKQMKYDLFCASIRSQKYCLQITRQKNSQERTALHTAPTTPLANLEEVFTVSLPEKGYLTPKTVLTADEGSHRLSRIQPRRQIQLCSFKQLFLS